MNWILFRIALEAEKREDAPSESITKHQKHPPITMARLREPDQLPAEAQRYKDRIKEDSAQRPGKQCENCDSRHFHRHQQRLRWFFAVVCCVVCPIRCRLSRWRCVDCGVTFTHFPSLCVPFKRYLRPEIQKRAEAYVETNPMTYRKVVKEGGAAVVYDDPIADGQSTEAEKEAEAVRELAPSTPHRWISGIADSRVRLQPVVKQAQQAGLGARLSSIMISPAKYRSEQRKQMLEACCLLLRALKAVSFRNPTRLATLGSSP